jgi:3-phosphoshikimate 1-carboxyvinyltransferase
MVGAMSSMPIQPVMRPFRKTVRIPGSKSISNRALPLAALAEGASTLRGVLFADDTWQMIHALQALDYDLQVDEPTQTVGVQGRGPQIPARAAELHCGNSGTTLRFLTALVTLGAGTFVLDGVTRMRQRPIDQLVDQLRALGATIDYAGAAGFPPVRVSAAGLPGGACTFTDAMSSQYISAVLLAAPYAQAEVFVHLPGAITSEPYVTMTLRMMEQFGVTVAVHEQCVQGPSRTIVVPHAKRYRPQEYRVEPDASNASYFLAAAALFEDAAVTIEGLGKGSLQGDVAFADVLHQMGAGLVFGRDFVTVTGTRDLHGIDLDMNQIPDMVQTLAVVALFAEGPTTIRNVWNLRVKETDRLAALENELRKLGAVVATTRDSIRIEPPTTLLPAAIATYDDHRMAMAFALAGLRAQGVSIADPACVGKTYPGYFADLAAAVA